MPTIRPRRNSTPSYCFTMGSDVETPMSAPATNEQYHHVHVLFVERFGLATRAWTNADESETRGDSLQGLDATGRFPRDSFAAYECPNQFGGYRRKPRCFGARLRARRPHFYGL